MLNKILIFLLSVLPIVKFKVEGKSMEPYCYSGDTVLVNKIAYFFTKPKINDVIAIESSKDKRYIIKVIKKIKAEEYFVLGFSLKESTDSRVFGWISKKDIIGKVIKIPSY